MNEQKINEWVYLEQVHHPSSVIKNIKQLVGTRLVEHILE